MSTRRTLAAVALAVTVPFALGACGTSFNAQTNQQYQAAVGANLRTGPIGVYGGLFVDNGNGTATFSGALLASEAQTITAASVDGQPVELSQPIRLTANTLASLGTKGEIVVESAEVTEGVYVTVTFEAQPGGAVSIEVPVVTRTAEYDSVSRGSAPAPTAAPQTEDEESSEAH